MSAVDHWFIVWLTFYIAATHLGWFEASRANGLFFLLIGFPMAVLVAVFA